MKFFISYSHVDKKIVQKIILELDKDNVKYFFDEKSIALGENIKVKIQKNLRESTHLVLVVSSSSIASQWVSYEIGFAESHGIKIIPFFITSNIDIPFYLSGKKYCYSILELLEYIKQIKKSVNIRKKVYEYLPDDINSLWNFILSSEYLEKIRDKEIIFTEMEKWRESIYSVTPKERDKKEEHYFIRGIEHYVSAYLSKLVSYTNGNIPFSEMNSYRMRTIEAINNGLYPMLEL